MKNTFFQNSQASSCLPYTRVWEKGLGKIRKGTFLSLGEGSGGRVWRGLEEGSGGRVWKGLDASYSQTLPDPCFGLMMYLSVATVLYATEDILFGAYATSESGRMTVNRVCNATIYGE